MSPGSPAGAGNRAHGRLVSLDILRAIAVWLVICHHIGLRMAPDKQDLAAQTLYRSGWIGVDLFFAISGFLIVSIVRSANYEPGSFFRKRVFRILPLYVVSLAVFVSTATAMGRLSELCLFWSPLLLLNGWTAPFLGVKELPYLITWSLSVEETAYALFGIAAMSGHRTLRNITLAMVAIPLILRPILLTTGTIDATSIYYFVPARLDAIAIGGLAALGLLGKPCRLALPLSGAGVALMIVLFSRAHVSHPHVVVAGYALFSYFAARLVAGLVASEASAAPDSRFEKALKSAIARSLAEFGKVSYFIYLFHLFVAEAVLLALGNRITGSAGFWTAMIATSGLTCALARFSWRWFETPMIERGRRESWRLAFDLYQVHQRRPARDHD